QVGDACVERQLDVQALEQPPVDLLLPPDVHRAEQPRAVPGIDAEVLQHGHLVHQADVLVNHGDPVSGRFHDGETDLTPEDTNSSRVRPVVAGEALHQGRL